MARARSSLVHQALRHIQIADQHAPDGEKLSGGSIRTYTKHCSTFLRWAQERYGLTSVKQLTRSRLRHAGEQWLREGMERGVSPWTTRTRLSALQKLAQGIGRSLGITPQLFSAEFLGHLPARRARERRRGGVDPYSRDEAARLIGYCRERRAGAARAVELMMVCGLRNLEAAHVRVQDVEIGAATWGVWEPLDPDAPARGGRRQKVFVQQPLPPGAVGVVHVRGRWAKGGRDRDVPLFADGVELLVPLLEGKAPGDLLVPRGASEPSVNQFLRRACARLELPYRSEHQLRKTFAERRLDQYLAIAPPGTRGERDRWARYQVDVELGHGRSGVSYAYCAPRLRPGRRRAG